MNLYMAHAMIKSLMVIIVDLPAGSATFDINNHTFLDDMSDIV